jgi:O-Antigen ligase
MTELAPTAFAPPRPSRAGTTGRFSASLLALALLGVGFADLFNSANIPFGLALAGGLALVLFLALTITHYDTAIAIGLLLMGIVRFEPAPPDIAFAVIMAVAAMTGRFRLNRVPQLIRWMVGLLLVVNLLSMMDVLSTSTALRFLFITVYLVIFSLWLTGYVDSTSRARLVVVTWLVVGVISAVVSAAALNLPVPGRSFILGNVDNAQRASGFFKDPNVFGPFLIPIALILLEQRIAPRSPRLLRMRGSTSLLCLLALTLGILLSYSRAAWLNFALALLIMLAASAMRRKGARRALRALAALLLIGGVTAVILSATGSIGFLEHRAQLHQSYDNGRFAAQSLGWELGWTHPVGIGPGQFESYSPVAAQSTFVRVFSEQGPVALLLWVALVLATLVLALRNVVVGRDTYGIGSAALLGAWCGLILNSVVVDTLHWRHMWVVAALIWASTARDAATRAAPAHSRLGLGRPRRLAVAPRST